MQNIVLVWTLTSLAVAIVAAKGLLFRSRSRIGSQDRTSTTATDSGSNSTVRALPSHWYRSEELFQLEQRAIFSKRWMLVTHKLRLASIGDWVKYEEAGFSFFLCKDRQGQIHGFHNVCRHRAFPLVMENSGQSKILACKYHGWSYALNGALAKAPGYQDLPSFDKTKNGLFPLHIHVDAHGFIWVNLDAGVAPEIAWTDMFARADSAKRHEDFNFHDYRYDHSWDMVGDYNWKVLADNYNECYHCPTTHPDAVAISDLHAYKVETTGGIIEHFAATKPEQEQVGLKIVSNFYFPNACMTISCVPVSATKTMMEYEVYRHKDASDEDFDKIDAIFKRILNEDKWLCNNTQKNLSAGVFTNGEMHPGMEKGPLFFQQTVRDLLARHRNLEKKSHKEIWPATPALHNETSVIKADKEFCLGLACSSDHSKLDW